ncbi:MAG: SpoIIE family protein phosphatase [Clostridia bacterium]
MAFEEVDMAVGREVDKKKVLAQIFKYFGFFVLMFLLGKANINGVIFPFAFGMLFALVWCDQKVLVLAPLFVLAMFLTTFSLATFFSALICAVLLLIFYGIHFKAKKPIKVWMLCIYALISQGGFLGIEISLGTNYIFAILSVLFGMMFMLSTIHILSAVRVRGFAFNLTVSEIGCAMIVLLAISSGAATLAIFDFEFVKLFASLVILISAYAFNITTSLMFAGVMGLGTLLNSNNPMFLSAFIIWALAVCAFKYKNRFLPCISMFVCELALGFYFRVYFGFGIVQMLPVLCSCVIFLLIPSKVLDEVSGFFSSSSDRLAMRNIVDRNRAGLSRRLLELADVFKEMNKVFRAMISGGVTREQAKEMLVVDIKERVCNDCPEKHRCHRVLGEETNKIFMDFVDVAFEKGKVSLLDVPAYLTSHCQRTNNMIAAVNELVGSYRKYAGMMNNLDASKVLIAEQLLGISGIFKDLSGEINLNISFDAGRETKILNELTYNNIICSDAVVYEQSLELVNVVVVVKNDCVNLLKIEQVVSKVCKIKMSIVEEAASPRSGWHVLTLKTAPMFDVVFGTAACTKTGSLVSGDSYSLIRATNDKFMLALCDGMGSGVKAEKASNLAIGLVENFYKAGFDNDIILSSVNKLLALGSEEIFSALDLCVIDLKKGTSDLIKLGAPYGFIKRKHQTEVIESGALPLGIVGNVQPCYKKSVLENCDMIVLCTDGITDSFMSKEDLQKFISESTSLNPQVLAEEILNRGLENCKGAALDDMTVLCARVFRK